MIIIAIVFFMSVTLTPLGFLTLMCWCTILFTAYVNYRRFESCDVVGTEIETEYSSESNSLKKEEGILRWKCLILWMKTEYRQERGLADQ